jgi:hypothetical protein
LNELFYFRSDPGIFKYFCGKKMEKEAIESHLIGERRWRKKQLKATWQQPFKLRTEVVSAAFD